MFHKLDELYRNIIGYGDYTEIVKKRTRNDITRRRASSTDEYSFVVINIDN